ncbi:hypothetical protein PACILC2_02650 [Paenibacillus cisolokensis]|uniref:Uncharacterized protein n=1 Tax=Paenibacillus cisolokensis TaxID=1658519 RepID=A0ABQ4N0J0_9BACL|nr:hypothetical protein PACILC2_02650 [Paenibacillus cisolokensis]
MPGLDALPEPESVDPEELLNEQTQMLFEKLDGRQMTIDEVEALQERLGAQHEE